MFRPKILRLPSNTQTQRAAWLTITDDHILLTDTLWPRRLGTMLILTISALFCLPLLYAETDLIRQSFNPVPLDSIPRDEKLTTGCITAAIGLVGVGLTIIMIIGLNLHRRFTLRVDLLRRTLACRAWLFGIPIRSAVFDIGKVAWNLEDGYDADPTSNTNVAAYGCILHGVLMFMGPIGWIISLVLMRENKASAPSARIQKIQETIRLVLYAEEQKRAIVTLRDENVAERFIVAWDATASS